MAFLLVATFFQKRRMDSISSSLYILWLSALCTLMFFILTKAIFITPAFIKKFLHHFLVLDLPSVSQKIEFIQIGKMYDSQQKSPIHEEKNSIKQEIDSIYQSKADGLISPNSSSLFQLKLNVCYCSNQIIRFLNTLSYSKSYKPKLLSPFFLHW